LPCLRNGPNNWKQQSTRRRREKISETTTLRRRRRRKRRRVNLMRRKTMRMRRRTEAIPKEGTRENRLIARLARVPAPIQPTSRRQVSEAVMPSLAKLRHTRQVANQNMKALGNSNMQDWSNS
jgi:hypothetical protein